MILIFLAIRVSGLIVDFEPFGFLAEK